ncbi:UDP-3-O-(3-hydroxymyristoyl)glucosamine N-acyltransferase [Limnobacter humi]|uniref:UDP-3-O-acylglucosamine N-acyltransferase n=1 Tax=Limnobacter humi TaxID=1778671 RepID=A0ABT1WER8_9BURK|nr:UDP-3-O-(3-hydroxymyristoyl)glucosamine N-acyltransferase [Limnobacter humi]MCQ8896026.1 UDP-3-O-(3-hydroxymyristoyl)glucosamine N-acyltransferase [Limnobacter humi]
MKFIETALSQLVVQFGGNICSFSGLPSQSNPSLRGIQTLEKGTAEHLGFLANPKYKEQLLTTRIGVVMVKADQFEGLSAWLSDQGRDPTSAPLAWLLPDPYLAYAKIQQWWLAQSEFKPAPGIHPTAVVDPLANIDPSASVGPNVVIGAHAVIANGVRLDAGVVIGRDVQVGTRTRIYPNVTVYDECVIGSNCILHAGCVIGADGFGFAPEQGHWVKIPQVGRVVIADDVEVGANTTIDRGALDDTVIGFGVKLDNQIMIAHNVQVGERTAMAGCVGVAGSTRIGARCTVGGAAMILGHLNIPDGTHISAATTVMSSIKEAGAYTGIFPMEEHKNWERTAVSLKQLVKLRGELRDLQKK